MSLFGRIYARILKWKVKNNPTLTKMVSNADSELAKSRKDILELVDGDKEKVKKAIPKRVSKALGFDF